MCYNFESTFRLKNECRISFACTSDLRHEGIPPLRCLTVFKVNVSGFVRLGGSRSGELNRICKARRAEVCVLDRFQLLVKIRSGSQLNLSNPTLAVNLSLDSRRLGTNFGNLTPPSHKMIKNTCTTDVKETEGNRFNWLFEMLAV